MKISKKQAKIERQLKKVYAEIDAEREPKCTGCGRWDRPLSRSHLIPRSRRPDLVTCKENIKFHCLDWNGVKGCHNRWEEGGIGMFDYDENMAIVKRLDPEYYQVRLKS